MSSHLPFGKGGSSGGQDRGATPEQNPNVKTGGAPAGPTFGADLPVSNPGSNVSLGNYTPTNERG